MTIGVVTRLKTYTGNDTAGPFTVPFQFYELEVYLDGVLQTLGVHYQISQPGGVGQTGEISFTAGNFPTSSPAQTIQIVGATSLNQGLDLLGADEFDAENVELGLDRVYAAMQETQAIVSKSIRTSRFNPDLPELDFGSNPSRFLGTDENGIPVFLTSADNLDTLILPLRLVDGGLGADVSAFSGTVRISGGAAAAVSTVSQAEAEAGSATTVREWTAQRVNQAIQALALNQNWTRQAEAYTASNLDAILADTVAIGAFAVTLPASPAAGDAILFVPASSWETNNLTVARNGNTIMGESADLTVDVTQAFGLVWDSTDTDWRLFNA